MENKNKNKKKNNKNNNNSSNSLVFVRWPQTKMLLIISTNNYSSKLEKTFIAAHLLKLSMNLAETKNLRSLKATCSSRSYLCYAWWRWPRLPRPFLHWLVDLTAEGPRCGTTTAASRGTGSRCSGVAAGQPRISLAPAMKIFNGWVLWLSSRVMGRPILRLYCSLLWKRSLK